MLMFIWAGQESRAPSDLGSWPILYEQERKYTESKTSFCFNLVITMWDKFIFLKNLGQIGNGYFLLVKKEGV